jgi:hypothetical protein
LAVACALLALVAGAGCGDPGGTFAARLLAPASLMADAESVVVAVLDGVAADGSPLGCSTLLSSDDAPYVDGAYLLLQQVVDVAGGSDAVTVDGVLVGTRRVFYVEVYDAPAGQGKRLARGCTDGIEVAADAPADVEIELKPEP